MSLQTLCVCPNRCGAHLIAECSIRQPWVADSRGELVRELSTQPNTLDVLSLKCGKCGANAEEVDCLSLPVVVLEPSSATGPQKIGVLYLPAEGGSIAY